MNWDYWDPGVNFMAGLGYITVILIVGALVICWLDKPNKPKGGS